MADLDDFFEWIEDAFEDVFEDAFDALKKRGDAKALVGGCALAAVALAVVLSWLLGLMAVPRLAVILGGVVLAASALVYLYFMHAASERYREGEDLRERYPDRYREEGRRMQGQGEEASEPRDQAQARGDGATAGVGDVALLSMAGIALALTAGFVVTGHAGASTANGILTGVLGALGAGSVVALGLRWRGRDPIDAPQSDRDVRAQAKRIRGKCKRLRREARKTGGVYSDLTWHADEMRQRARELADTVIHLRKGFRQIARSKNPTLPTGVSPEAQDERLQTEYEAARNAQARLDEVIGRNRRREHLCLAQLERIEDLVDAARLELTHPVSDQVVNGTASSVAEDLETELELSRQALEEVQQQSELEA